MKTFLTQFFVLSLLTAGVDLLLQESRFRVHARFACQLIILAFLGSHLAAACGFIQSFWGG